MEPAQSTVTLVGLNHSSSRHTLNFYACSGVTHESVIDISAPPIENTGSIDVESNDVTAMILDASNSSVGDASLVNDTSAPNASNTTRNIESNNITAILDASHHPMPTRDMETNNTASVGLLNITFLPETDRTGESLKEYDVTKTRICMTLVDPNDKKLI